MKSFMKLQRNRELLAMIGEAFDLDFPIEEGVEPGGGIKIAERVYVNQDYQFEWPSVLMKRKMKIEVFVMAYEIKSSSYQMVGLFFLV